MPTLIQAQVDLALGDIFGVSLTEVQASPAFRQLQPNAHRFYSEALGTQLLAIKENSCFVTDLLYVLLGLGLVGGAISDSDHATIVKYVLNLWVDDGFTPVSRASRKAKLMEAINLPADIYASFYAITVLDLLGATFDDARASELTAWVGRQKSAEGWYFNLSWAETLVERKLQNELTRQTLFALLLLKRFDALRTAPGLDLTRQVLTQFLGRAIYMGPMAQTLQALELLGVVEEADLKRAVDFAMRHFDEPSGGFFEYLMEEAKRDETAGQVQRYGYDSLESSILATYRALQILVSARHIDEVSAFWRTQQGSVASFFRRQTTQGGGFGSVVKIAKLDQAYGPVVTPQETIAVLAASTVAGRLSASG